MGSGLGLSSREERAGRWNSREVGRLFLLDFMLAFPSGLRPEHGGRPEEEYIAGGCGSPGHCFCGGEERVQGIWGAWAERPCLLPTLISIFPLGPGNHLLLLSGQKYPKWL